MLATGDLYYFGARGLPRDQTQALSYYDRAAETGNPAGLCAAAGMYLKGEGTEKNVTKAIAMYEEAAAQGSVRALNGLGYIYFYGQEVPQNTVNVAYCICFLEFILTVSVARPKRTSIS